MRCQAQRTNGRMKCARCDLIWDAKIIKRPECKDIKTRNLKWISSIRGRLGLDKKEV